MRRAVLAVMVVFASFALPSPGRMASVPADLALAEIDADQTGTDRWEFVELAGPPGTRLDGYRLIFFSGGSPAYPAYRVVRLDGWTIGPRGRFVVGSANVDAVDLIGWESGGIQNGEGAPDAVALYRDDAAPRSPLATSLVDVVVYGDRDDPAFRARFNPANPPPLLPLDGATTSLARGADRQWRTDWPPSPGFANGPLRLSEVGQAGEIELVGARGAAVDGLAIAVFDGDARLLATRPLSGTLPSGGAFPGGLLLPPDPNVLPVAGGTRLIAVVNADAGAALQPATLRDAILLGDGSAAVRALVALSALPPPGDGRTVGRWAAGGGSGAAVGPTAPALGGPNFPPDVASLPIGEVHGPRFAPDGCERPPRWIARTVRVRGVVTALLREDALVWAVVQDEGDGDDRTPDGILLEGVATVGDRLTVSGVVGQRGGATILREVTIEGREPGAPLPPAVPLAERLDRCAWSRLAGMRVAVPAGATASSPRVILGGGDSFVDVVLGEPPGGNLRLRRVFGHDQAVGLPNDSLVRLTAQSLRVGDPAALLPPFSALDGLAATVTGVVVRLRGRPVVALDAAPIVAPRAVPETRPLPSETTLRIATFNLRNFFDRWDDPTDPGDNPGAPHVPPTVAAYRERLFATADLILGPLGAPDVLVVQEAEDQDLCHDGGQVFGRCGVVDNADGVLDVLHDLSLAVAARSMGAVAYRPAADRSGVDSRGILTAVLYRPDRLSLRPPTVGPTGALANPAAVNTPASPAVAADGEGALLFARPPLVMRMTTSAGEALIVIGVHFKSDPSDYRPRRAAQAAFVVERARLELAADPTALIAIAGDFNAPASALPALRSALPGGPLVAALERVPAAERYTFLFDGVADAIDQLHLSPALAARLRDVRVVHGNADRPDPAPNERGVPPRLSDHDPIVASFGMTPRYVLFVPSAFRE